MISVHVGTHGLPKDCQSWSLCVKPEVALNASWFCPSNYEEGKEYWLKTWPIYQSQTDKPERKMRESFLSFENKIRNTSIFNSEFPLWAAWPFSLKLCSSQTRWYVAWPHVLRFHEHQRKVWYKSSHIHTRSLIPHDAGSLSDTQLNVQPETNLCPGHSRSAGLQESSRTWSWLGTSVLLSDCWLCNEIWTLYTLS